MQFRHLDMFAIRRVPVEQAMFPFYRSIPSQLVPRDAMHSFPASTSRLLPTTTANWFLMIAQ
jgi:hypothetical protein